MTREDLKRVHEIGNELLLELDRICKEENIQYFLFYGTLIGAIRHSGPIPWDDDVDVCMTRPNYLKFIEACNKKLNEKYLLKIMGASSGEYISELKIGKKGTVFCLPGFENLDIMNMVQLDVFCLDTIKQMTSRCFKIKNRLWEFFRIAKLNWSEKKLLMSSFKMNKKKARYLYDFVLLMMHCIRLVFGEKNIERFGLRLFVDKTGKSNLMNVIGTVDLFHKDQFEDIILHPYDGHLFPIPADYDELLRIIYGDYMTFPPENKRYRKLFDSWVFKESAT